MKKLTKLLSLFVAAGAMAGAVAVAGCSHKHTYDNEWSTDETSHWHQATCEHSDRKIDEGEHDFGSDLVCDVCGYDKAVHVTLVSLDKQTASLKVGEAVKLIATVTPSNASFSAAWQSDNTSVATVDSDGNVTAVAAGEAKITATADGKGATCTVTVTAAGTENPPTPQTKYKVTYDNKGHGTQPDAVADVTALPETLPTLTEAGWTFNGWYLDEAFTEAKKATAGAAITADTTLYASWTQNQVTPPDEPDPPVTDGKMSEADFKAAIQATLDATAFTYTAGGVSVKIDGANNAFALSGGSYAIYDSTAKKLTGYSPIADFAWEKEELANNIADFATAKELMTGNMSAALNAFKNADYSLVTYDKATGKYSIGTAFITFEGGKVSSFGEAEAGEITFSDYGVQITLPDFSLAFENIVSVNIAKNAVGSKLDAKTETSGYGFFAEMDDAAKGYITASAEGYKQTVVTGTVNSGAYINLAGLGGNMEGYFEVSASAMGSKWDIIQVRNGENKLFSVRVSDDKNSFVQKKFEETTYTKVDGFTVAPAENTTYKVKYSLTKDATGGNYKLTMTINGQAFATDYDLGADSVESIYLTSSNVAKAPRVLTIDNVIICGTPAEVGEKVNVTEITLNKYKTRIEQIGATDTLVATVAPENATNKTLVWSSSDTSVATVDQTGKVTAVNKGTAVISAMASNGKTVKCTVTVGEAPKPMITVTFDDGEKTWPETAEQGGKVLRPTGVTKEGYTLLGWAKVKDSKDFYDFDTPVEKAFTLYAVWEEGQSPVTPPDDPGPYEPPVVNPPIQNAKISYFYAANESAAIEWQDNNIANAKVEYKLSTSSTYTLVDKMLIRQKDATTARVDIIGLKGGATYDFKITTSGSEVLEQGNTKISAYDRSGYAHFKYTDGVGAYNDDGTLKDNALVIYVTESNKNDVTDYVYKNTANGLVKEDISQYIKPGKPTANGKDLGGETYGSIGYILNNRGYESNIEREKYGIQKLTFTYGGVVVRILGKVTSGTNSDGSPVLNGLTYYAKSGEINPITGEKYAKGVSVPNGGTVGDNGNMARIINAKNLTIEGIGEDARMFGWGLHFVSNDNLHKYEGSGKSFEVRNLTFECYPEDAVGMEGTQGTKVDATGSITSGASSADSDLISPVERCWIHHNTFLPGYSAKPAESDKAEGDGSCDFKRGQYFTCSYNYFEYCHKTNLVGSSDSSLQFNLTYHHNMWYQCGSRIPLTRQANVHFYNNYVCYDATETTTPYSWISKPAGSYVHSLRASCYIFSEANYYEGSKNITDGKNGGAAKGWNNVYYANFGTNTIEEATTREQRVSNTCKFSFRSVDYSSFDTNPSLFYYDATNKKSACYLTDAVTARQEVLATVGVQGFTPRVSANMLSDSDKPAGALNIGKEGLTIDLTQATVGGTVSGVKFINAKNSSGSAKGKGLLATFTLAEKADITISGGSTGDAAIELVREDGYVVAGKISSFTGSLEAGTYFIASGQKDKDGFITSLSFKSGVTDDEKVQNVINYINAIGEVAYTEECKNKINAAQTAYNALGAALKEKVTNAATLTAAVGKYNQLSVNPVIAAINAIGTVNEDSGMAITEARTAYNKLTTEQKALVTNYATLTAAEAAYEAFEIAGINKQIAALAAPSTATTEQAVEELLEKYKAIRTMYEDLDEDQKAQVTGYSKVTEGITALENALKPYAVKEMIEALPAKAEVTLSHSAAVAEARKAYDALDAAGKTVVGDITKLTDAEAVIAQAASQSKVGIFAESQVSGDKVADGFFTVSKTDGSKLGFKSGEKFTYDGTEYTNPVKIESRTTVTFTTTTKMTMTMQLSAAVNIMVDGKSVTADSNGVVTIVLEAGDHTIARVTACNLYYIVLTPVAE